MLKQFALDLFESLEFIKKYESVENFKIYGNERFIYQYISDKYPQDEIKFDISKIRLYTIDIETRSENGFPDVESADQGNPAHYYPR